MRTVAWDETERALHLIDQRLLPNEYRVTAIHSHAAAAEAIQTMVVRGAPAIGAAAAYGLALAGYESRAESTADLMDDLERAAGVLRTARPTAVNLAWALDRLLHQARRFSGSAADLRAALELWANDLAEEDIAINRRMAEHGASLIADGDALIHHCNTGALAAVDWGTALGAIRMAHRQGKRVHVFVDETRPRLQGARLTAWELEQYGIDYEIIVDGAAGYLLRTGAAQKVFFGADRVAANGDVANKIGTYMLALAAADNGAPAYAVVPASTVDLSTAHGGLIPIEEREMSEVLNLSVDGRRTAPAGAAARNPAFDVTPSRLITAIVTEHGIVYPPYTRNLKAIVGG